METQLDIIQAEKAVHALQLYLEKTHKKSFISDTHKIHIQFQLKKVSLSVKQRIIKLILPHSQYESTDDVCLFVKDLDASKKVRDYEPTKEYFSDALRLHDVKDINEIIPLKALRLEYKPNEAKLHLSNRFDIFLVDDRIAGYLPKLLGKYFYGTKNFPLQVNMKAKKLSEEISKAINNSRCFLSKRGSTSIVPVAHTGLTKKQIAENVMSATKQIADGVPGGRANIRSFYIKTLQSPAIPIYVSSESGNAVKLPVAVKIQLEDIVDEVTTVEEGQVVITPTLKIYVTEDGAQKRKNFDKKQTGQKRAKMDKPGKKKGAKSGNKSRTQMATARTKRRYHFARDVQ